MLFLETFGQEIRPRRAEDLPLYLPTHGKVGWGGGRGEGKNSFRRDVIAVMVKARGSKAGNAYSFIRTHP